MISIASQLRSTYVRKDGKCAVFLQILIHSEIIRIPLNVHWFKKFWKDGRAKERFPKDLEARDVNLIIQDNEAKANEILIQYRLRRREMTKALFESEWVMGTRSNNFIRYMEQKMDQRLREREISLSSHRTQLVTLNHLKAWKKIIPFETLNERTAYQFEEYLLRKTGAKTINARWGQHKNFKCYLNHAHSERIEFVNPYNYFTAKSQMGRFQPLHREELVSLWQKYLAEDLPTNEQDALRAFLVVCVTGLRHGDIRRFSIDWIDGDMLSWVPEKTQKHGTAVRVPMTDYLRRLIGDELHARTKKGMFRGSAEQKQNEYVRAIGQRMKIKTQICYQVGRETFATLYMEADGKLEVLASFMGHTTTKMSEKYVKIRDQRKKEEAQRIAGFLSI